jgi:hypothetical protein
MGGSFPHGQPSDNAPVATAPIRSPTGSIASSSTAPPDRQAISAGPGTGRAHVRGVAVANGRLRLQPGSLIGSWSIAYHSGPENGHGANIDLPLRRLDGLVIRAGGVFDFWRAVGEVSSRAGYRRGGIIVGDHVDPGGALAGGICAVSTALFNAAARAGLQIRSRHAHSGYLARYPLGLDAAVASGSGSTQTLAFRNDTDQPIQIRTLSLPGLARASTCTQPARSAARSSSARHASASELAPGTGWFRRAHYASANVGELPMRATGCGSSSPGPSATPTAGSSTGIDGSRTTGRWPASSTTAAGSLATFVRGPQRKMGGPNPTNRSNMPKGRLDMRKLIHGSIWNPRPSKWRTAVSFTDGTSRSSRSAPNPWARAST